MTQTTPHAPIALVVDDLLLNRVLLTSALRRLGYAVMQAADGEEALRLLAQKSYSVVFLDWDLPGIGGDAVTAWIGAQSNPAPIVAITADDSLEMRTRCQRAGVAGFLGKSFDLQSLRAILATLPKSSGYEEATSAAEGRTTPRERDALAGLLGRSREHLMVERAKLEAAMNGGRTEDALRALHNITSLASMVGALPITEAARLMEECLRTKVATGEKLAALDARLAEFRPTPPAADPRLRDPF